MIGRNEDVNTETFLDQMLLPSDTSFVLNFKAKVNKMENKQVEVKAKV
jgi:hypothetical protein